MPPVLIDLVVMILLLGLTYALSSEGLWGSALMFFNALFAGLIAFNFYEPLAGLLASAGDWASSYADTFCLLMLFLITLVLLRVTTDSLAPAMVRFPKALYHAGRVVFGFGGAAITVAILLLAFHTSPVHKKMFWNAMNYDRQPPFNQGLDWKWLSFFQFTSGQVFARYGVGPGDPRREYGDAQVFDPDGRWLIDHQNARPYGEGRVPELPEDPNAAAAPAEGAAPVGGGRGGAGGN